MGVGSLTLLVCCRTSYRSPPGRCNSVGGSRGDAPPVAEPRPIQSLAVLPFVNLSGDPSERSFADGMTDLLISRLAEVGVFAVISRTSVMRYKETDKSLPEIAAWLNVDAVIEGAVLRVADRVRINAQLIDAATDRHLWATDYEWDLQDVLALQSEIARAITEAISAELAAPAPAPHSASERPVFRP